jgi:hypothetical protein
MFSRGTRFLYLLPLVVALASHQPALAWGMKGHMIISRLGAQEFPADMPAFTRTAAAVNEISALGPEEDWLKGSGQSWDDDNDPAHYVDIGDNSTVLGVKLDQLPESMAAYAQALAPSNATPWSAGYLPYAIVDGFEQLREDFAWWRVDDYGALHAPTGALRSEFALARQLREDLTLRDIGVWSHFVADGSQPLHVTVHFNGWDSDHHTYPNPNHYTDAPIHSLFESDFVNRYVTLDDVQARMNPEVLAAPKALLTQVQLNDVIGNYLAQTNAAVEPLYRMAGTNGDGFRQSSASAVAFTATQLARGAAAVRDLTSLAWENSAYGSVGYPSKSVQALLAGTIPLNTDLLEH